jgi:hypothetical protein
MTIETVTGSTAGQSNDRADRWLRAGNADGWVGRTLRHAGPYGRELRDAGPTRRGTYGRESYPARDLRDVGPRDEGDLRGEGTYAARAVRRTVWPSSLWRTISVSRGAERRSWLQSSQTIPEERS